VLCCHLGSSSRTFNTSADAPTSVILTLSPVSSILTMVDLMWCDAFSRFPDLRFSLTEGDIGWIPYFLWRAEHVLDRHQGWTGHTYPSGVKGPTDVFRRNILCCFIDEPVGVANLHAFNIDNVCWESDYPHSDGIWPDAPEVLMETFVGIGDENIDKITHLNAMAHYRFNPFATRTKDQCRVGALRAQTMDVDTVTRVGGWPGPVTAMPGGSSSPAPTLRTRSPSSSAD